MVSLHPCVLDTSSLSILEGLKVESCEFYFCVLISGGQSRTEGLGEYMTSRPGTGHVGEGLQTDTVSKIAVALCCAQRSESAQAGLTTQKCL